MKRQPYIAVVNPGSTSTKLGYFHGEKPVDTVSINHLENPRWPELSEEEQFRIRLKETEKFLENKNPDLIMARGGLLKPLESGVYRINEKMLNDLENATRKHASNLAAPIAKIIADKFDIPAYIADPVTVDELQDIARYSGHPYFPRQSIFHALNQKAVARKYAHSTGKSYEALNLIVVHMGGGISIGAHKKGKVIDVNQALDGEGPFSPERSGTLPAGDLVRAAFSGKYNEEELLKMITGSGGLKAYLGTADVKSIIERNHPDEMKVIDAMIYQIVKYIGAMLFAMNGKTDAVILTGGLALSGYIVRKVTEKIRVFVKNIQVYPGENELEALAYNGFLLWKKEIREKPYI
jgi:butyrate kinase